MVWAEWASITTRSKGRAGVMDGVWQCGRISDCTLKAVVDGFASLHSLSIFYSFTLPNDPLIITERFS